MPMLPVKNSFPPSRPMPVALKAVLSSSRSRRMNSSARTTSGSVKVGLLKSVLPPGPVSYICPPKLRAARMKASGQALKWTPKMRSPPASRRSVILRAASANSSHVQPS